MEISRRQVLATGIGATAVLALGGAAATTAGGIPTLYDGRLPQSRALAAALPGAALPQLVTADPSQLLTGLEIDSASQRVILQGVTPESVPFCLEHLIRRNGNACVRSRRLERDLFAWSLQIGSTSSPAGLVLPQTGAGG